MKLTGKILRSTSEGYQIFVEGRGIVTANRRKGKEPLHGIPLIGDIAILDDDGLVKDIEPRHGLLTRPRVANVDQAGVLVSALNPPFSSFLLDKYLTGCHHMSVPAFIVITKWDLLDGEGVKRLTMRLEWYRKLGYKVFEAGLDPNWKYQPSRDMFRGKTTILMGQTGVGKSTLANRLEPEFKQKIGTVDEGMGRGRHQTKEVVLYPFASGFLGDTPGFSDFELDIPKPDLAVEFPGFDGFAYSCKFKGCLHNGIKGCAVAKAVKDGKLSQDSYDNYLRLLAMSDDKKGYEKKTTHSHIQKEEK